MSNAHAGRPDRHQYRQVAGAGAARGRLRRGRHDRPLPPDGRRHALQRRCPTCWRAARTAGFAGVNVTFPFKEAVIPLLDEVSAEAREIGAVNTVVFDANGTHQRPQHRPFGLPRSLPGSVRRRCRARQAGAAAGRGRRRPRRRLRAEGPRSGADQDLRPRRRSGRASLCATSAASREALDAPRSRGAQRSRGIVNATPIGMTGHRRPADDAGRRSRRASSSPT